MFKYLLKKELTLILRDIHALLVLFAMPTIFILIMSLALKNSYSNEVDVKFNVGIVSQSNNEDIKNLVEDINKNSFFNTIYIERNSKSRELLYENKYDFLVSIDSQYFKNIKDIENIKIDIFYKPDASLQNSELLKSLVLDSIKTKVLKSLLMSQNIDENSLKALENSVSKHIVYRDSKESISINSTQQSVPAWLVFSMFFILIPISNTFINEKNYGTINRIRTINTPLFLILISKIFPYYIINQIQVLFMILVGVYLVPLLGGYSLSINGNYFLIFLISSVVSIASISFALLIANISKTTEEATTFGGVANIILAALGGIMVPKFVMPQFMQEATNFSPMAWALESFLEVFVRLGTINDIAINLSKLTIFALICLIVSYILLAKNNR